MRFEDLIGLIISVAAFLFLIFRSVLGQRPHEEEEQEEVLTPPPVLPPTPKKKKHKAAAPMKLVPSTSVVSQHYEDLAKSTPYEVTGKSRPGRANLLISGLKSKKEMIILREVVGPPKGLSENKFR